MKTASMHTVAIIDYHMGNTQSVANAFESLGANPVITNDLAVLESADALVLPGVGAFPVGMKNLESLGLIPILNYLVLEKKKPFLGLCLGMQLIAKKGFEVEECNGLGWIDATVKPLSVSHGLKVPHVGWNDVLPVRNSVVLGELQEIKSFYFVHSFIVEPEDASICVGTCEYGNNFTAVIERGNIMATQFHPEKSQKNGLQLLSNFLSCSSKIEEVCNA